MVAIEFGGDERFTILGRIGAGGMGVVYKAHDRERGGVVALKTLHALGPAGIFRLKQEFRALADLAHPNLVALHELVQSGEHWFMTMEHVEGTNFLAWVRPGGGQAYSDTMTSTPDELPGAPSSPSLPHAPDTSKLDEPRLRAGFAQLAAGVAALHAAGKLHRDIKPSNVLVTPDGRVVLLDFGLVTELRDVGPGDAAAGTAAYMAPEQIAGQLGAASDWYAAGVMLYEALTGRRPFVGPPLHVLDTKRFKDPPRPREVVRDVPEDLDRLCMELLQRDPARRPAGGELLRAVGAETSTQRSWGGVDDLPLVGRVAELAALERAFARARHQTTIAIVRGPSGIGKSRLVRAFLESLRGRALVLAGRCYERESVPFKAVDSLMDALCSHLMALPLGPLAALTPVDAHTLARVFPALGRIDVPGQSATWRAPTGQGVTSQPEPFELRQRAFGAMRDLVQRLGARSPLVLHVDDLQWGDADSASLLDALLAPPEPPPLLLLGCHRADDLSRRPLLKALLAARPGVEIVDVELGPLDAAESRELAERLCGDAPGVAEAVAREAGGSPFFLFQLAQRGAGGDGLALDDMLHARLAELSASARQLLAVIALAAVPIPQSVAIAAAGLPAGDPGLTELERLRAARLVRTDGAKGSDAVECYHDRIRDAAGDLADADLRRRLHGQLAHALDRDPTHAESLAEHFFEAGDVAQAAHWAAVAADRAAAALAFDRAAELYRRALAWQPEAALSDARRDLHAALGDALAAGGRGEEAGRAYLEAAEGASRELSLERRHKAAEQLMHSGHTDEGSAVLLQVLRELGVRAPITRTEVLTSLAIDRAAIRLRGHRYRERAAADVPALDLLRLDACWSAMTGFTLTSAVRPFAFQARYVRGALRAGEPRRLAIAFAGEAFVYGHDEAKAARFNERAYQLAERTGDPAVQAIVQLFDGWRHILIGSWPGAREKFASTSQLLREHCTGQAWARDTAAIFEGLALAHLGRFGELRRHVGRMVREAEVRGDRYLRDSVPYHLFLSDLAADEPGALREAVHVATVEGLPEELGVAHWGAVQAEACAALYQGRATGALRAVEDIWPGLERSLLLRSAAFRREALTVRARVHIGCLIAGDTRSEPIARAMVRALAKDRTPATRALATLMDACLQRARGRVDEAAALFETAAAAFDAQHMSAQAAAARWRRGELLGGTAGADRITAARDALLAESVRKPERFIAVLAPT